jgi:hypothetical protein
MPTDFKNGYGHLKGLYTRMRTLFMSPVQAQCFSFFQLIAKV